MTAAVHAGRQVRGRELVGLAVLVLVTVLLRGFALSADPLPDTEGGFIWDWGEWAKNARLHALVGSWTVDDYNQGLYLSSGYTLALRLAFALFGIGQAQAILVNVASGLLMVLAVYAIVRVFAPPRAAWVAAFLMAINPLMVVYDRSGYPESFQLLFIVLAVIAIFSERPWVAILGGVAAGLAIVAKGTGLVIGPIVAVVWASLWAGDRFLGLTPKFSGRQFARYAGAASAVLLVFAVTFVVPNWDKITLHLPYASKGILTQTSVGSRPDRVSLFGYTNLGFRMNGFFWLQWYLISIAAVFAAARITRTLRQPVTQLELACWAWLGFGGLYLARMFYQPDRRFLILVPPLVILSALFLGREIVLGQSKWSLRMRSAAFALGGAVLGGVAAFYFVRFFGPYRVMAVSARAGHPLNYSASAGLLVTLAVLAAALLGWAVSRRFSWTPAIRWQWVLVPLICGVVGVRWASQMSNRTYTISRVSAIVARLTEGWPPAERFMRGASAATFAMNTHMLGVHNQFEGLPTLERFHIRLDLAMETSDSPLTPERLSGGPGRPDKVDCAQIRVWPLPNRSPWIAHFLVEPDRLAACREAARLGE